MRARQGVLMLFAVAVSTTCSRQPTSPRADASGGPVADITDQTIAADGSAGLLVSVTALDFGDVPVGTTAPQQTVDVTNVGLAPVTLSGAGGNPGGDFTGAQNCQGVTLAPGQSCHMTYGFQPTATGVVSATSSGSWNGQTYSVVLHGAGVTSTLFQVTPTGLDFGEVQVGTASKPESVIVKNVSGAPVTMNGAGGNPGGAFTGAQSCQGLTLQPGDSCRLIYNFLPSTTGSATAASIGTWNGQPFNIALKGTGLAPQLHVSPSALEFGEVPVGSASPPESVTVTNAGTSPVTMNGAGGNPGGAFTGAQSCQGLTLQPGQSCRLIYNFIPSATGSATGASVGTWNGVPFNIALHGTGIAAGTSPTALFLVTPTGLDFGEVQVGTTSKPESVTVKNISGAPVTMSGAGGNPGGAFTGAQSCQGLTLQPGDSCRLIYNFIPTAVGSATAASIGTWNGQPFNIALKGTGATPHLHVTPVGLDFGDVPVGSTSPPESVTVTNVGTSPVTMNGAGGNPGGAFTGAQSCQGLTLQPGQSCRLIYNFLPTATGSATGASVGTWNGVPFNIALHGNGTGPKILISPVGFQFGVVPVGGTSADRITRVTNIGPTAITMNGAGGNPGGEFTGSQSCQGLSLAPGQSCEMRYTFQPTLTGPASAASVGTWNGQPFDVALAGIGGLASSYDFLSPVTPFPEFQTANAGKVVPLHFSLDGDYGLNILAPGSPTSGSIACGSPTPIIPTEPATPPGASGLTYDPSTDQYSYLWKTDSRWAGTCRQVLLKLIDGSVLRANFEFR